MCKDMNLFVVYIYIYIYIFKRKVSFYEISTEIGLIYSKKICGVSFKPFLKQFQYIYENKLKKLKFLLSIQYIIILPRKTKKYKKKRKRHYI